jgi:acetyl esterase/lipase
VRGYTRRLIAAGVEVTALRTPATFHDFVMLKPLAATPAATAAVRLAGQKLSEAVSSAQKDQLQLSEVNLKAEQPLLVSQAERI